ncbi:MAG TPA: hypothetical protein PKH32_11235, partial [Verrucomicrobiota bacterium]|nr:hypothetical protein [Verrucomicrobiota bacterium]
MKRNGSDTEAAGVARLAGAAAGRATVRSAPADMGNEASIALFLCATNKTARLQFSVEMHRPPVRPRQQHRSFGQCRKG